MLVLAQSGFVWWESWFWLVISWGYKVWLRLRELFHYFQVSIKLLTMCFFYDIFNPRLFPPLSHQVKVYPLAQCEHGADDVLVLGTDGLWDVLSNQEVAEAVTCFLANCDPDDQHRHVFLSHSCSRPERLLNHVLLVQNENDLFC